MVLDPTFDVEIRTDDASGDQLIVGLADPGVAGLTAVDYLISNVSTTQIGHVATNQWPDITPFSDGRPRHPIRLYNAEELGATILISEVFLPMQIVDQFAHSLTEWVNTTDINEVTVMHGSPFQHSEDEHLVYGVATDEYRERNADLGEQIPNLPGGFFDGIIAELISRGMDGDLPPTGVLLTPTHPPGPDIDAALVLLNGLETVYGYDIDETELRKRSEEMRAYYDELIHRIQDLREGDISGSRDFPEDRMYM